MCSILLKMGPFRSSTHIKIPNSGCVCAVYTEHRAMHNRWNSGMTLHHYFKRTWILGFNDWHVSSLFSTIEIQTRTLSKGQNVTVIFMYLGIFFLTPGLNNGESDVMTWLHYLKRTSKLVFKNWHVSPLFSTIEIETRTLSKGQNVTVIFMYLRIFFPIPPPLQNTDLIKAYKMDILWCLVLKKVKIWAY